MTLNANAQALRPNWLREGEGANEAFDDVQMSRKRSLHSESASIYVPPMTPTPTKTSPALDPTTIPRLRTSMSSHDRLIADDSILVDALYRTQDAPITNTRDIVQESPPPASAGLNLLDLPDEVQQRILDMLMGELRSTSSRTNGSSRPLRNWNSVMRHPRSRKLADMALVCRRWRTLIQERIYRHIKLEGTVQGLQTCYEWFFEHPDLTNYVRHVEFWIPIWERRGGPKFSRNNGGGTINSTVEMAPGVIPGNFNTGNLHISFVDAQHPMQAIEPISAAYCMSSQKATLDEIFDCVSAIFPLARILTIEGGQCKRPPMIDQFRDPASIHRLAVLPEVQTLVLRGAWNLMREDSHFQVLTKALPSLKEWHCSYTKPKTKAYRLMHSITPHMPSNLSHLNLCLDGFYSQKSIAVAKAQDLLHNSHLCLSLGAVLPQLEVVTLSGRFCAALFTSAIGAACYSRSPRLRSIDVVVKNCCREQDHWNDSAGIHNWGFITAFEQMVTATSRSLRFLPELRSVRIRYVDLDAPSPLLNPYFQMQANEASGLWNEEILANIAASRPTVSFSSLSECIENKEIFGFSVTRRPKSIRSSMYAAFVDGTLL